MFLARFFSLCSSTFESSVFPFFHLLHSISCPVLFFLIISTLSSVLGSSIDYYALLINRMVILSDEGEDSELPTHNCQGGREVEAKPLDIAHYSYKEMYLRIVQVVDPNNLLRDGLDWRYAELVKSMYVHGFVCRHGMIKVSFSADVSLPETPKTQCLRSSEVRWS